ncbi:MAG: T9SS type A sorting domain-containing protein, partial [Gelidibacter sp.]|nr:T9SS type A sorting domain-containing protein [Gelidibacter sp.]
VEFTATDECGRTAKTTATFTIEDNTAPVLTGVIPSGQSNVNACFDDMPMGPSEIEMAALYYEACGAVVVTKTSKPLGDNCSWAVLHRYEIADECGNSLPPVKIYYNGGDYTAPELISEGSLPQGQLNMEACYDAIPEAPKDSDIAALFADNCGGPVTVVGTESVTGNNCAWEAVYTYTVKDACNNYAPNVVVRYTGGDHTAPVLTGTIPMGQNSLNLCLSEAPVGPSIQDIASQYTDNCGDVIVTKTPQTWGDDCSWIRLYVYTIKDACNNYADEVKVYYNGGDQSAPVLSEQCVNETMIYTTEDGADCPAVAGTSLTVGQVIGRDTEWDVANIKGTLPNCFTDNCAAPEELTYTVDSIEIEPQDSCSTIITIKFDVEDNCENIYRGFECIFIIVDDTAPVVECPEGEDFGTDPTMSNGVPVGVADKANYTDNCQPSGMTSTFTDELSSVYNAGGNYVNRLLTSEADFSGSEELINFDEVNTGGAIIPLIGNEYSAKGVTISSPSGGVFGIAEGGNNSCNIPMSVFNSSPNGLTNDADGCPTELFRDIKISFANKMNRVGFYLASNSTDDVQVNVICMSNGNIMATETFTTDTNASFFGMESIAGFDAIVFDAVGTSNSFMAIDDIRFEGGGNATEDFTLVRTFTHDDGCGNIGECSVTYTWSETAGDVICGNSITGNTANDGAVNSVPFCGTNLSTAKGIYYTYIGTGDITTFSTCSANTTYDTKMGVFTDNGATCVAGNDDAGCAHSSLHSTVSFLSVDGQEYQIYVTGFGSSAGDFELSVACEPVPPCEILPLAILDCGDTVTGDTSDAGAEDVAGPTGGIGNWYTFIGNGENVVTFSTCNNTTYDSRISVFTDCTLTPVADNDDSCGLQSEVEFFAEFGVEYNIFVRGFSGSTGEYELNVTCGQTPPPVEARSDEEVVIDFKAYPVPFDNEVTISYSFEFETNVVIELYDTKGLLILSAENNNYKAGSSDRTKFDLSRTSNQMFYVKLTTSQGSVTKKIVSSSPNRR